MSDVLVEITVKELAAKIAAGGDGLQLVDVREVGELEIASIEGFLNVPLSEYEFWQTNIHTRLEREAETLVLCHHGMRSAQMCHWLMSQGFTNVKNISGGIDAYSIQVDHSLAQY